MVALPELLIPVGIIQGPGWNILLSWMHAFVSHVANLGLEMTKTLFLLSVDTQIGSQHWRKIRAFKSMHPAMGTYMLQNHGLSMRVERPVVKPYPVCWGKRMWRKKHYYVKSLAEVVRFLSVNEPAFCGSSEGNLCESDNADHSTGLFLKLFEYTLTKDTKLAKIARSIPQNAKYTSNHMQKEIIDTLAQCVLNEVKQKYKSADTSEFCIKSDGTRDRCNVENLSLVIIFVRNSVPEEHLIGLLDLEQLNAEYITSQILTAVDDQGYSTHKIIRQYYDGASVMSGISGGVQALLQKKLGREISTATTTNFI